MKLLFLDIDGVLNDHTPFPNGYCGIKHCCVKNLNRIMKAVPDLQVVLTSSWRYAFSHKRAVEAVLLCHGAETFCRVHGSTERDNAPKDAPPFCDKQWWHQQGLIWRGIQIKKYLALHAPLDVKWAVLDDLPVLVDNLFQTDPKVGLTAEIADEVIKWLNYE